MFKTLSFLLVLTGLASAQPVSAGLKIGVPLTDAFTQQNVSTFAALSASSNPYTIGPYIEVRLPASFSLEADALYRSYNFTTVAGSASKASWQFPIVAKYKLWKGPVRPYIEGGLAFSHLSDAEKLIAANHASNFGIVLGGGVEIHALVLRISPEIRYTGDVLKSFDGLVQSNRNQVAFLVGIGF
jgi:hypothetical protein